MSAIGKSTGKSTSGLIEFVEIPGQGLRVDFSDPAWLVPEADLQNFYAATIYLQPQGQMVLADGEFELVLDLVCDRCQQQFKLPLAEKFKIEFEPASSAESLAADHHCSDQEMDVVFYDEPRLDPAQVLQQQVALAMPVKRICGENCRGLCPGCGVNLNNSAEKCSCRQENDSPFGVLAALKK